MQRTGDPDHIRTQMPGKLAVEGHGIRSHACACWECIYVAVADGVLVGTVNNTRGRRPLQQHSWQFKQGAQYIEQIEPMFVCVSLSLFLCMIQPHASHTRASDWLVQGAGYSCNWDV